MTVWSMSPLGYAHELDLLEIKLAEQSPVVDHFVIHEAAWHYDGTPKETLLNVRARRWAPWRAKITHVVVEEPPPVDLVPFQGFGERERWQRENWQRMGGEMRGSYAVDAMDVVLVSDLDEILRADTIAFYQQESHQVVKPELPMHRHFLNLQWRDRMGISIARLARGHTLHTPLGWEGLRRHEPDTRWTVPFWLAYHSADYDLAKFGWHFSWMGGERAILDKLVKAAHPEELSAANATVYQRDAILERGMDIQGENRKLYWRPDTELPAHAQLARFAHLRCDPDHASAEQSDDPTYWRG